MYVLIIDPSRLMCDKLSKYVEGLGHTAIAVHSAEAGINTLSASVSWQKRFGAVILTADCDQKINLKFFVMYLNMHEVDYGRIPCLVHSDDPIYTGENDRIDLRTLENRFPFVWYHERDQRKLRYISTFFARMT